MTTNKPEVFEVYRTKQGTLENVVLLADYEALQAECEELRKSLVLAGRWVPAPDPSCKCDECVEDAKLVAAIDAAMQADTPC